MSKYLEGYKEKSKKVPVNLYISEGRKYMHNLHYTAALTCFQSVLEKQRNNKECLLGRGKCYLNLGKYKESWDDFNKVLEVYPKCIEAIYFKGLVEYLNGNFEDSFSTFRSGNKIKPTSEILRLNYQMSEKAILNSYNEQGLTSKDVAKLVQLSELKKINDQKLKFKGLYSKDLEFLEELISDENLVSAHDFCKDLYLYLNERQRFRKMQSPFENKNHQDTKAETYVKSTNQTKCDVVKKANKDLEACKSSLKLGNPIECLKVAERVLNDLRNESESTYSGKYYTAAMHYMGLAHLMKNDVISAIEFFETELNVAVVKGLEDAENRALQSVGDCYWRCNNYEKAVDIFLQNLERTCSEELKAIYWYKISDCYSHLDKLEAARKNSGKTLNIAKKTGDKKLEFDVLLLLAEISLKEKDIKVAEDFYEKALSVAEEIQDVRLNDVKSLIEMLQVLKVQYSKSDERISVIDITESIRFTETEK